jgi:hypothetical protein
MHWNLGHFAAIVKESNGPYQIEDPTFWRQYGAPQMISPCNMHGAVKKKGSKGWELRLDLLPKRGEPIGGDLSRTDGARLKLR